MVDDELVAMKLSWGFCLQTSWQINGLKLSALIIGDFSLGEIMYNKC